MKFKTTLILLVFFLCAGFVKAQKIKIKKGIVYLNETAILKSDSSPSSYSLYDLNGNEIIFIRFSVRSQLTQLDHDEIKFLTERVTIETTQDDYTGLSRKQTVSNIIKWLLKEKVLTSKGKVNAKQLDVFHYKYHDGISEKINIIRNPCDCNCNDN